jgi:hypothetical protein
MMKIVVAIVILIAIGLLVWPALREGPRPKPNTRVIMELASLRYACLAYRAEFGTFPTGATAQTCLLLSGKNLKNIPFMEWSNDRMGSDGTFLDFWGTPYRMDFQNPTNPVVRSAGKDRSWGTKDDIEGE